MSGMSSVLSAKKSPPPGRKRPQPLKVGEGPPSSTTATAPSQTTSSGDLGIEFFKSANPAKKDPSWAHLSPITATTPSVAVFGRGHYRQFLTTPSAIFFESPMTPRFLTAVRNSGIVYPLRTPKQLLPPQAQKRTSFNPQYIQIEHNPIPHKEDEPTVLVPKGSTSEESKLEDKISKLGLEDKCVPMDEDFPETPLGYELPPLPSTDADKESTNTITISINPDSKGYSHEKTQRFILDQILACGERLAVTIDKDQAEPFRLVTEATAHEVECGTATCPEDQELARLLEEENRRVDELKASQKQQEDWKEEYWQKSAAAATAASRAAPEYVHPAVAAPMAPEYAYSAYGYAPPGYYYGVPAPISAYYSAAPFPYVAPFVMSAPQQGVRTAYMNPSEALVNPPTMASTSPVQNSPPQVQIADAGELPNQPSPVSTAGSPGSSTDQLLDFAIQAPPDSNPYVLRAREGSVVHRLSRRLDLWPQVIATKKGVFRCSHCGDKFARLIQFAAHIDEAHVARPFPCSENACPWSIIGFSKRSENSRHMKHQHAPHRMYRCEYATCIKSFSRKDSLKRHLMLVHDNSLSRRNRKLRILAEKKRRGSQDKYDEIQEDFE